MLFHHVKTLAGLEWPWVVYYSAGLFQTLRNFTFSNTNPLTTQL